MGLAWVARGVVLFGRQGCGRGVGSPGWGIGGGPGASVDMAAGVAVAWGLVDTAAGVGLVGVRGQGCGAGWLARGCGRGVGTPGWEERHPDGRRTSSARISRFPFPMRFRAQQRKGITIGDTPVPELAKITVDDTLIPVIGWSR